jgi:hypothetical protein
MKIICKCMKIENINAQNNLGISKVNIKECRYKYYEYKNNEDFIDI